MWTSNFKLYLKIERRGIPSDLTDSIRHSLSSSEKFMFEFDDENKEHPIGTILRYYREQRGIDLDAASEQLRIKREYLADMEQDRFDLLPGGMYRRSFLRAYAAFLKLDPDQIMKMFDEQHHFEEEDQVETRTAWMKAHLGETQQQPTPVQEKFSAKKLASFFRIPFKLSASGWLLLIAILVVLLAIFFFFVFKPVIENKSGDRTESTVRQSAGMRSEPVDTLKIFLQMAEDSVAKAPEWTLKVNSIGDCWMNLDSDGKRLFSAMVFENMNLEFKAKDSFTIYSGKNQGLILTLNGFKLKLLPGGVTTLNRQNIAEFISTDEAGARIRYILQ
jgi:cytoskeletal protein RodZ